MQALNADTHAATLLEIARDLSATLTLTDCVDRICALARTALDADRCSVILWSDRKQSFVAAADSGTPPHVYQRFRGERLMEGWVPAMEELGAGRTAVITAASGDPKAGPFLDALGVAVEIIAPFSTREIGLGALAVSYERVRPIDASVIDLVNGIAHQAAIAIENARLFTNIQKAAEFRAALTDLSLALSREVDSERIQELVCTQGRAALRTDAAVLLLTDHEVLRVAAVAGDCGVTRGQLVALNVPDSIVCTVLSEQQTRFVNALRESPYGVGPVVRGLSAESVLVAPLLSEGRASGVLLLTDAKEPYRFSQLHVEEASILATTAAVGLDNARLLRAQREESHKLAEYSRTLERSNHALAETTEDLRSLNREMEELLYIASHDLRAPLINIEGFAHEARRELDAVCQRLAPDVAEDMADIAESLRFVHSSAAKMDTLITALLDVSRIASRDLARQPIDLTAMARRVADSFEFVLKERGIVLTIDDLPEATADPVRLEQVFSNLIDNAIKYMGDGPRLIAVGAMANGAEPHYFVRDSGIGMTPSEIAKVFRLFRRGRATNIAGEGIGLTLVRKIIERHGGRVWIESEEGAGSTVWFTLRHATG